MSGSNDWPRWLVLISTVAPAGTVLAILQALRMWRGDASVNRVAQERVNLEERKQLADARLEERKTLADKQTALDARGEAEILRLAAVHTDLQTRFAAEVLAGLHWFQVARAWCARAWDKLSKERALRDSVIEAREGWAGDRRGWFAEDPAGAGAARRPEWMGPPPAFTTAVPPPISDPPELEEIAKP